MGGGGGSKTVEVVEYVYEDPKHSITSQQMVDLFGHEQRQAGQQDIFQGADIVGRRAQPTPTVTEVARYLKDTTGANVISVPESSVIEGSGGIGTGIEEFQTSQLGQITSNIAMDVKAKKPDLPKVALPEPAAGMKITGVKPKTAEQTLTDIQGFSDIATSAQQGGIIPDPSVAQQTAVGFPGSDVSSNLYKQPLAPITEQMQRAKLGAQEGLRVPETLANEPELKPEVPEGKGEAMGLPQLFNKPGAGKDADDIEAIAEPDDFILNSKVKEIEGEKDIDAMLAGAIDIANRKGYRLSPRITNLPKDKVVPLLVSKDEIRVPKVLAKIIGYDKLTKMNNRGKAAMKAEEQRQATGQQVAQAKHGGEVHSQKKKFKDGGSVEGESATSFQDKLKQSESSGRYKIVNEQGYMGAYQFGDARLKDYKDATGEEFSREEFLANDELQDKIFEWHIEDYTTRIKEDGLDKHIGTKIKGVPVTHTGLLAVAHLGGYSGMTKFLKTQGKYNPKDKNKTSLLDYLEKFSTLDKSKKDTLLQNTEVPFVDRILNPENYIKPKEQIDSEGRSFIETHRMSSRDNWAFPTVVIEDNKYIDLMDRYKGDINAVFDHNKKTGDILRFPSDEEAQNFSMNYKDIPSAQKFNEYYTPDYSKFEEEDRTNREKIQRKIYDTAHTIRPHVDRLIKTGELPQEQFKSFMSDAVKAKVGDAVVDKAKDLGMYPNFLDEIDVSAEIKGKDDFSVRAEGFEYEENPFNRRIQKTFGEPEGIHGSVGIDQSKYRDDTYVGGKLVFPLGKPKK